MDDHNNFGDSTVAVVPSPAVSGLSLTVATGEGARFTATPPYNITICPIGADPTPANAEIVTVTALVGDVFTIVRAQEGTVARTILVGDKFSMAITSKMLTDIATDIAAAGGGGGGGLVLLATRTASNSPSLDFTSLITSTYDEYMLELINVVPVSNGYFRMEVSIDNGANWAVSGYRYAYIYNGDNGATPAGLSAISSPHIFIADTLSNTAGNGVCGSIKIFNPLSAFPTSFAQDQHYLHSDTNRYHFVGTSWYVSNSPVDAFRFIMSTGNLSTGTIRLYGIEK